MEIPEGYVVHLVRPDNTRFNRLILENYDLETTSGRDQFIEDVCTALAWEFDLVEDEDMEPEEGGDEYERETSPHSRQPSDPHSPA